MKRAMETTAAPLWLDHPRPLFGRLTECSPVFRARLVPYADELRLRLRDVFLARDGETAYFGGVGFAQCASFVIGYYAPDGTLARTQARDSDALGLLEAELRIDAFSDVGTWHAVVHPAGALVSSFRDPFDISVIAQGVIHVTAPDDADA